jgi:diguanylate cyclase (GGDEF)-like protein
MMQRVFGERAEQPFELRIYSMSAFISMLMSLGAIVGSLITSLPGYIILMNAGYLCACGVFYLLSRFRQETYPKSYLAITQLFLSVIWFANGGLKGSIPYFFFVLLFVALIVCKINTITVTLLVVGNFLLLIVLEHFQPDWVVQYQNEHANFLDIATSVPLLLLLLAFWISMLKTEYDSERFMDPLTGLSNRKQTLHQLKQFLYRERTRVALSIAFFDVDHFKKLNDTYGHAMGDQVLKRIGEIALEALRNSDIVGRYGGEEFLIGLPRASKEDALQVMERIRHRVSETRFECGAELISTSISIGLVSLEEDEVLIGKGLGIDEVLSRLFPSSPTAADGGRIIDIKGAVITEMVRIADELMYRAKMPECGECGHRSKTISRAQGQSCTVCGSEMWVFGRNRIVTA